MLNIKTLESLGTTALIAGKSVMGIYNKEYEIKQKELNHPITEADIQSHNIIQENLYKMSPNINFFSEESKNINWEERKKWKRYWLVDPLDGTKEFIKKNGEFTINIALIENHEPVMGVIYAPCFKKIYLAAKGIGSFLKKISIEDNDFSLEKSIKLKRNNLKNNEKLKIICSRSHQNSEKMNKWLNSLENYELKYSGSSIKFCLIAEGSADIYPRFKPTSEWDIAAGHCILNESGGKINTLDGKEILYNKKESLINPEFIASVF